MNQSMKIMCKAKVDNLDPLINSPKKFKYFCDPHILPLIISKSTTEKSDSKKKNIKKRKILSKAFMYK